MNIPREFVILCTIVRYVITQSTPYRNTMTEVMEGGAMLPVRLLSNPPKEER
jgi:hypothetical protein